MCAHIYTVRELDGEFTFSLWLIIRGMISDAKGESSFSLHIERQIGSLNCHTSFYMFFDLSREHGFCKLVFFYAFGLCNSAVEIANFKKVRLTTLNKLLFFNHSCSTLFHYLCAVVIY